MSIFKEEGKKFFGFIKYLYKPALVLILIQATAITLFLYDNRGKIKTKIPQLVNLVGLSFDTFHPNDYKEYLSDLTRSIISRKQLKRVDLSLSFKDKLKLECDRKRKENCTKNGWVKAELYKDNEKYRVKLRAKGDREIHRIRLNNMSFKTDLIGDKRFLGMEEFSIQLPIIRNYTYEPLAARLLRKENISSTRNSYIRLYINGEYVGVRHLEEAMSKELVESSKKRYGPIYSIEESISTIYENAIFDLADKKYWQRINNNLEREALTILESSQTNPEIFNKYFDNKKWAKYMAMLDTLMMIHGTVPKSVKFYLNPVSGLIEPIFFDGHHGGWFHNYRLSDAITKNNLIPKCTLTCENMYFYRMMFGNGQNINYSFYKEYFNSLENFTSEDYVKNILEKEWKNLWLERGTIYREFNKKDSIYHFGILPNIGSFNKLKDRFKNIRNEVLLAKYLSPKFSFSSKENFLKVTNLKSRLPQILKIYCNNKKIISTKVLAVNVDNNIDLNREIKCDLNQLSFSLDGGKNLIPFNNVLISDLDLKKEITNSNLKLIEKESYVFEGIKNVIKDDLELNNSNIVFKNGTEICLSENSIFKIINSDIEIKGDSNNPILIRGCTQKGGSLLIENSNINIGYLKINNLAAPQLKLRSLYGGLNILYSNVYGGYLEIENSKSEDGINFINTNANLENIKFKEIKSDALDSDFSKLVINKISCVKIGNDCVDLSFSEGKINHLKAEKISDKVLSLGEESSLNIEKVDIQNSEIGIVAKDSSILNIKSYNYQNVKVPIAAYVKKREFGPAKISIFNIKPKLNNLDFISKNSLVFIENDIISGYKSSKSINDLLYGNNYGVKTAR